MSYPRGGKIDWSDKQQVNEYNKLRRRNKRRNKPAAPGVKGRGKPSTGFLDVAYSTENYHDELNWDIDMEKIRRNNEE